MSIEVSQRSRIRVDCELSHETGGRRRRLTPCMEHGRLDRRMGRGTGGGRKQAIGRGKGLSLGGRSVSQRMASGCAYRKI